MSTKPLFTKQQLETDFAAFMTDLLAGKNYPTQSDDHEFLQIAIMENLKKIIEGRVSGMQKQLVKDGKLRDLKKDKCTEDTVLYDGATVRVHVELGTPRSMFDKEKMVTQLQLRGVSKAIVDTCMKDAEKKSAAPQSIKYDFL